MRGAGERRSILRRANISVTNQSAGRISLSPRLSQSLLPLHSSMTVYMPNRAYSLSTATAYPLTKGPMSIAKIVLSPACAPGAREFLQYANISEVTVFPDIQGLVAYRCQFDVTV